MNRKALILGLLTLAAGTTLAVWQMTGVAPQPNSSDGFSAERIKGELDDLLREQQPHPVESALNKVVRDRIIASFDQAGYQITVQRANSCGGRRTKRCANVENILALPPRAQQSLVLLVAHYDSSPKGPGASDDGVGVATLIDIMRIVHDDPRIGFLITDGEEKGLLGAEAFARDPNLLARVGVVINVENRGTSGPSLMFETSRRNANLVSIGIRAMKRPATSSLFPAIYELLPNDTDLSVFKRAGKQGVNLAAIGGVEHYHQPHDDLAHVNLRTMQHHGDNALAMARAFAAKIPAPADQNAVFFDFFGFFVISWPERFTMWMLFASLIGVILAVRRVPRSVVVVAAIWHLLAFVAAWKLPGSAYLFAFPAFACAIGAWLPAVIRTPLTTVAATVVAMPLILMLRVALGPIGWVPTIVLVLLVAMTLLNAAETKQPAVGRAV